MPSAVCRHHPAAHTRCHPPGADRRHHRPRSPPRRCARTRPSTTPPACAHVGTAPPYLSLARAHESLPIREQERSTHASTRVRGRSSSSLSLSRSLRSVLSPVLLTTGATIISAVAEAEGVSLDAGEWTKTDRNCAEMRQTAPNGQIRRRSPRRLPETGMRLRSHIAQPVLLTRSAPNQGTPRPTIPVIPPARPDDPTRAHTSIRIINPHHILVNTRSICWNIEDPSHRPLDSGCPGPSDTERRPRKSPTQNTGFATDRRGPPPRSIQKREKPPRGFEPRT
jgi:hypothetical protein